MFMYYARGPDGVKAYCRIKRKKTVLCNLITIGGKVVVFFCADRPEMLVSVGVCIEECVHFDIFQIGEANSKTHRW
jgi:hypothetical protein